MLTLSRYPMSCHAACALVCSIWAFPVARWWSDVASHPTELSLRCGRSALQGLLRKLGGGLEDIMPHRAAESNQRMKVCYPRNATVALPA